MVDNKINWRRSPQVGVFRPNDERMVTAVELLEEYGITPIPDPMLSVEPTGTIPEIDTVSDASPFVVLTVKLVLRFSQTLGGIPPWQHWYALDHGPPLQPVMLDGLWI
jgi:uroporphyrinogen-III synthase (EC 4.2.1.75)